jgi:tagatose-1,6-bisphosphate aldolase
VSLSAQGPRVASAPASLRPLASPAGAVCVLALDHRDAMRNAFRRAGVPDVSDVAMLELKARIVDAFAGSYSATLLDAAAVARCHRPGVAVLVPLEEQGHEPLEGGRLNRLMDSFGPSDAARLGAQGCKLLLYYRADHPQTIDCQLELVVQVLADCHRRGLPLVVEPLVYRLDGENEHALADTFGELVIAAARDLRGAGVDMLKLQFPGDAEACERVTEAASQVPWVLLGGSDVDGQTFAKQLEIACSRGACGFIAGRAIWGDALPLDPSAQRAWLRERGRPLMERLTEIADTQARSRVT